jgi:transposase-like protein
MVSSWLSHSYGRKPEESRTISSRSDVPVNDRREAVLSLVRREEPATALARRYGVSAPMLCRWRDEFLAAGEAALAVGSRNGADPRDRRIAELERQIERRDQVIGELTITFRVQENRRARRSDRRGAPHDHHRTHRRGVAA